MKFKNRTAEEVYLPRSCFWLPRISVLEAVYTENMLTPFSF